MLQLDVFFDFICPWCLIGKTSLQQALAQMPEQQLEIRWRGVQLLPDLPQQGLPFQQFYLQRLGSQAAVEARMQQVEHAASSVGLALSLSRIDTMPNTALAHHWFAFGQQQAVECTEPLLQLMYQAYFQQQADLGSVLGLTQLVRQAGWSEALIQQAQQLPFKPFSGGQAAVSSVPSIRAGSQQLVGARSSAELQLWLRQMLQDHEQSLADQ